MHINHRPIAADAESRLRARDTVLAALVLGFSAVVLVGAVPLVSPNPQQTRLALAALLGGSAAVSLAIFVFRQMGAAFVYQRSPSESRMFQAHLDALKRDTEKEERMSAWLWKQAPRRGPTLRLSSVDLRGAMIPGVDLTGAQLREARLDGADLQKVVLRGSCLAKANLRGANLQGADLRGADIRGANFDHARVEGIKVGGAVLDASTVWPPTAKPLAKLGALKEEEALG